jgi:hypothetical protein
VTFSSGTVTLTLTDTNGTQTARNLRLNLTGTSGGAQNLIVPAIEKFYIVNNGCTDAITVKNLTGTGVSVPAGRSTLVFNNGTNVVDAVSYLSALAVGGAGSFGSNLLVGGTLGVTGAVTLSTALPVASGGTGITSFGTGIATFLGTPSSANLAAAVTDETGSGSLVFGTSPTIASPALTGTPTAPTAAVTTDNTQIATTAFVRDIIPTGLISLWSGSVASIPSGWFLCDGSNGTPDLRNRFIVGAGSTYAVGATGGSADATLVSHTHTASSSSSVSDPGHKHESTIGTIGLFGTGAVRNIGAYNGTFTSATDLVNSVGTGISVSTSTSIGTTGSSATNANLPPYYALAYIMKA